MPPSRSQERWDASAAESGDTAHELIAISGHRTLREVQRYTEDADKKILADSAARKRIANAKLANLPRPHRQTQGEATENTREGKRYGGPDRTRTCDLRFRKPKWLSFHHYPWCTIFAIRFCILIAFPV